MSEDGALDLVAGDASGGTCGEKTKSSGIQEDRMAQIQLW